MNNTVKDLNLYRRVYRHRNRRPAWSVALLHL